MHTCILHKRQTDKNYLSGTKLLVTAVFPQNKELHHYNAAVNFALVID